MDVGTSIKNDAISRFQKLLKRLGKGYMDDYSIILHEIAFIQTYSYFSSDEIPSLYEYFINNVE